jgi:predicted nucleic acid-binding protein
MGDAAFVDSSGWYALIDRRDDVHSLAASTVARLIRDGVRLTTTDYVIDESCTLARIRAGVGAARALLEVLDTTRALSVEWIGPDRFDAAKVLFRKQLDQGFSFTDCTSFVVMEQRRIRAALTTDAHFTTRGFEALLRAPTAR